MCIHVHTIHSYCIGRGLFLRCVLNFHYDFGSQGLKIDPPIKFHLAQSFPLFSFVSYTCTYICHSKCIGRDCFLLFSEKYIFNHDDVRHITQLYLSTKFHVCECCSVRYTRTRRRRRRILKINLTPFPGI